MKTFFYECPTDNIIYTIRIGRNAQENWDLIDMSDPEDIWFHVEDHQSAHVVLRVNNNNNMIGRNILVHCAVLCKQHSKLKNGRKVPIIYTKIKYVKKTKPIGSVVCSNEKNIII